MGLEMKKPLYSARPKAQSIQLNENQHKLPVNTITVCDDQSHSPNDGNQATPLSFVDRKSLDEEIFKETPTFFPNSSSPPKNEENDDVVNEFLDAQLADQHRLSTRDRSYTFKKLSDKKPEKKEGRKVAVTHRFTFAKKPPTIPASSISTHFMRRM